MTIKDRFNHSITPLSRVLVVGFIIIMLAGFGKSIGTVDN
jgi:hypothetical protein